MQNALLVVSLMRPVSLIVAFPLTVSWNDCHHPWVASLGTYKMALECTPCVLTTQVVFFFPSCLGRSVCTGCSETTNRVRLRFREWSPHSAGWGGPYTFLADSEGDRRTHRGGRGRVQELHGPFDLGSGERQDRIWVTLWISQVYSLIFIAEFYFLIKQ